MVPESPDVDSLEVSNAFEFFFDLESCNDFNYNRFISGKNKGQIPHERFGTIALSDGVTKISYACIYVQFHLKDP